MVLTKPTTGMLATVVFRFQAAFSTICSIGPNLYKPFSQRHSSPQGPHSQLLQPPLVFTPFGVSGNAVNCLIAVMCFQLCDTGFGDGVVLYGVYRYSGRAVVLLVSLATVIMIQL